MSSYFDEHNCGEAVERNDSLDLLLLARVFLRNESILEADIDSLDEIEAPPASKQVVEELPRKTIKDNPTERMHCPICLEHSKEKDVFIELPCQHQFHGDCILPWLSKTNSCPSCRHELPTDNPDYEELRLRKIGEKDHQYRVESLHTAMFC